MWWHESVRVVRLLLALALAGLVAGCFRPLHGDYRVVPGAGLGNRLAAVTVSQIDAASGSRLARVSNEVRNDLLFKLTGGGPAATPTHRLDIKLAATQLQVIVDATSARPEVQNYGINATYELIDLATGKAVISGQTFSRVSYNIPGQQQRFAGQRGQRDAEDRAAEVIAEHIHSRLASYFVAGS